MCDSWCTCTKSTLNIALGACNNIKHKRSRLACEGLVDLAFCFKVLYDLVASVTGLPAYIHTCHMHRTRCWHCKAIDSGTHNFHAVIPPGRDLPDWTNPTACDFDKTRNCYKLREDQSITGNCNPSHQHGYVHSMVHETWVINSLQMLTIYTTSSWLILPKSTQKPQTKPKTTSRLHCHMIHSICTRHPRCCGLLQQLTFSCLHSQQAHKQQLC